MQMKRNVDIDLTTIRKFCDDVVKSRRDIVDILGRNATHVDTTVTHQIDVVLLDKHLDLTYCTPQYQTRASTQYQTESSTQYHFSIFRFHKLTLPPHILTLYRACVAAGAAYDHLNLSDLHYI